MKTLIGMAVLSATVLALGACATTSEDTSTGYVPAQRAPSLLENDEAYMAEVEAIARRRGIEVTWVNPPTRRSFSRTPE